MQRQQTQSNYIHLNISVHGNVLCLSSFAKLLLKINKTKFFVREKSRVISVVYVVQTFIISNCGSLLK